MKLNPSYVYFLEIPFRYPLGVYNIYHPWVKYKRHENK